MPPPRPKADLFPGNYCVERWSDDSVYLEQTVCAADNLYLARAAYAEVIKRYPATRWLLRQRTFVLEEHEPQGRSEATEIKDPGEGQFVDYPERFRPSAPQARPVPWGASSPYASPIFPSGTACGASARVAAIAARSIVGFWPDVSARKRSCFR